MELSNDVEKYEIEVNKMGQNYPFFLTVHETTHIQTSNILGATVTRSTKWPFLPYEMSARLGCIILATHVQQCFDHEESSSGKYSKQDLLLYWPEQDPSGLKHCCIDEISKRQVVQD